MLFFFKAQQTNNYVIFLKAQQTDNYVKGVWGFYPRIWGGKGGTKKNSTSFSLLNRNDNVISIKR
jgi:hypothetical protein